MEKFAVGLTIFFEDPFWVGIFERVSDGELSVCKVTFGAEPTNQELCNFITNQYDKLNFSPSIKVITKRKIDNPKRRQRDAKKQMEKLGIGTKSQQALKIQQEALKKEKTQNAKMYKEQEKLQKFMLKQQKLKEKRKGN